MSIEKRIDNVIQQINKEPFIFHREADIRALLYKELCEEYPEFYDTVIGYKTRLVHCEYFGGEGTRIDVVVLDKKDVKNIRLNTLTKRDYTDHVALSNAIEIKTVLGWYGQDRKTLAEIDIKKLINVMKNNPKVCLYYIYIVRWPTKKKEKQKEVLELIDYLKKKCKQNGIMFKTNSREGYFLGK
jgi:hypothetical protein